MDVTRASFLSQLAVRDNARADFPISDFEYTVHFFSSMTPMVIYLAVNLKPEPGFGLKR